MRAARRTTAQPKPLLCPPVSRRPERGSSVHVHGNIAEANTLFLLSSTESPNIADFSFCRLMMSASEQPRLSFSPMLGHPGDARAFLTKSRCSRPDAAGQVGRRLHVASSPEFCRGITGLASYMGLQKLETSGVSMKRPRCGPLQLQESSTPCA